MVGIQPHGRHSRALFDFPGFFLAERFVFQQRRQLALIHRSRRRKKHLLPAVLLLRKVVEPYLATYLHWLLALYAFNQVPDVFKFDPSFERLFFQSQLVVTIGLLIHLQRNRRKALAAAREQAAEEDAPISSEALPPDA